MHTATQVRNVPVQTPSDLRKLFKQMGVDYTTKSGTQVQKAIATGKRKERKVTSLTLVD